MSPGTSPALEFREDRAQQRVEADCLACAGSAAHSIFGGLLRCQNCGHVFAQAQPSDQHLSHLYTDGYFQGEEYFDYLSDRKIMQRNFRLRLKVLRSFMEPARHSSLLEIGCAYGLFLEEARSSFAAVHGIDVAEGPVSYAKSQLGLDVVCADLPDYDLKGRDFDVVCMWDTIEHLERPDLYVSKLAQHTRPGALIAITTGDFGSLNARLRRTKWRLMHPPTHAHYFSLASMRTLLERFGFDTIYERHCGYYRSLKSMAYGVFVQRHGSRSLLDLMERTGLGEVPLYLNLFDIMFVVGRKR